MDTEPRCPETECSVSATKANAPAVFSHQPSEGVSLWILICMFLARSDVGHPFTCFWAMCMFSLKKCLFNSFLRFSSGWFAYWIAEVRAPSYILDINPFLIHGLQVFSLIPSVVSCLFTLLLVFLDG